MQRWDRAWEQDLALARTGDLTLEQQTLLLADPEWLIHFALAGNPHLHPSIQMRMATSDYCRPMLAVNPNLAPGVQVYLARKKPWALADRKILHPAALRVMVGDDQDSAVRVLSRNASITPALVELLASRWPQEATEGLAANPAVTGQRLTAYVRSPRWEVRAAAAENVNLDRRSRAQLLRDERAEVRCGLARNPSLPASILSVLAADEQERVRVAAASSPAIDQATATHLLKDSSPLVVLALARNRAIPGRVAREIAGTGDEGVRHELASNPGIDPQLLGELLLHADRQTQSHALRNPAATLDVLKGAARDRDQYVELVRRRTLLRKWEFPHSRRSVDSYRWTLTREELFQNLTDPGSVGPLWDILRPFPNVTDDRCFDMRISGPVIASRVMERRLLEAALRHPDPLVRVGALANRQGDGEDCRALMNDPVPEVAHAARMALLRLL